MHWYYKQAAVAAIGQILRDRPDTWNIFGFHADTSDAMTDYFSPATWTGIAIHRESGIVLAVDVGAYTVKTYAGKDGWPQFSANPGVSSWHLEREGKILATGSGVFVVREPDQARDLVDRIEARIAQILAPKIMGVCPACSGRGRFGGRYGGRNCRRCDGSGEAMIRTDLADRPTTTPDGVTVSAGKPGNVEIRFASKPAEAIRGELKSAGYRWFGPGGIWYGPADRLPARYRGETASEEATA